MGEMWRLAKLGFRLICPACGQGRIFKDLSHLNKECPNCGVLFEPNAGDFLGAMVVAYSVTAVLVAAGVYILEQLVDIDAMVHVVVWSIFTLLFLLFTYRNWKGMWIGILHAMVPLKQADRS